MLDRTISVKGSELELSSPKRTFGFPHNEFSLEYENLVNDIYQFETLEKEYLNNIQSFLHYGFHTIPLQAIMLKKTGKTFHIKTSLLTPLKEPISKKMIIWANGSYTSEIEKDSLVLLCEKYNVEYKLFDEERMDLSQLLELYQDCNHSVFWISSHGEYNHYDPHDSIINISPDSEIHLRILLSLHLQHNYNRLLVLNMCESGVNSDFDGFKGMGFGHQLASPEQSIICHLWMIDPKVALVFGLLLAIQLLGRNQSYFDSFKSSLKFLQEDKGSVCNLLESELQGNSDIVNIVNNIPEEVWNSLLTWGSPAYFS